MQQVLETRADDELRRHLERAIGDITNKRNLLITQADHYSQLQKTITSSKWTLSKVMVMLGDGYFVEKNTKDAKEFLERRISNINALVKELNERLDHAKRTLEEITVIQKESKKEEVKLNEEGLPFMDIREEIDDDGRIIEVKINDSLYDVAPPRGFAPTSREGEIEETIEKDKFKELFEEDKTKELTEDIDTKAHSSETTYAPEKHIASPDKQLEKINKDPATVKEPTPTEQASSAPADENLQQIEELFEDMEITGKADTQAKAVLVDQDELLNKIDQLDISADEKFRLKEICVGEYAKLEEDDSAEQPSFTTSTPNAPNPNIAQDDILQLEILASDFAEDDTEFVQEDDEWDFEFDEDEDDDDADELLYGKTSFIRDDGANELLWKQISQLREEKEGKTQGKSIMKTGQQQKRKSVRFNDKLEINTIANVSEDLKRIEHSHVSRFKQERVFLQVRKDFGVENVTNDLVDRDDPISEFVVERDPGDFEVEKSPEGDYDSDSFSLDEQTPDFASFEDNYIDTSNLLEEGLDTLDEKSEDTSDMTDTAVDKETALGTEESVSDIVERSEPDDEDAFLAAAQQELDKHTKRKVSKFRQMRVQNPVLKTVIAQPQATAIPVRDTYQMRPDQTLDRGALLAESLKEHEEKDESAKKHEPETPKKVSRFKQKMADKARKEVKPNENSEKTVVEKEEPVVEEKEEKEDTQDPNILAQESLVSATVTVDYDTLGQDMDTMASAYVLGMYDDDIETEGPVVDKLDDFEILNRMVESMPVAANGSKTTNAPSGEDEFDENLDVVGDEGSDDEGGVLADEIVERDVDWLDEEEAEEEMEQQVLGNEIRELYFRMRQKVAAREGKIEGIDGWEDEVRVLRFKAQRPGPKR